MTLGEIKQLVAQERYDYSEQERDELGLAVHGMKYVILGRDTHGRPFYTVGKVVQGPGGQFYFYITAHQADEDF